MGGWLERDQRIRCTGAAIGLHFNHPFQATPYTAGDLRRALEERLSRVEMRKIQSWPVALRENLPLVAWTLFWSLSWSVVSRVFDLPKVTNAGIETYLIGMLAFVVRELLPILLLVIPLVHILRGGKARDFVEASFWASFARRYLSGRALGGFLVVGVCIPVFFAAYRDWKTAIPAMVPFWFDAPLETADRWLHGGRHAWEWMNGIVGQPMRTQIIDNLYIFWFQVQFGVVLWMAFSLRRWLRARFFIAYIVMYVLLGQLMAIGFASAGPVYFARVVAGVTSDPFEPLMSYLTSFDSSATLHAVDVQRRLWGGYIGTYDGPVSGISAFPSVHVAVATLFFLLSLAVHRVLAVGFLLFLAVTLIGSIHLGWHYALDGYASIVLVTIIWKVSGPLASRFLRWANLDALDDPSAPEDLRRVDPGAAKAHQRSEGMHEVLVGEPGG